MYEFYTWPTPHCHRRRWRRCRRCPCRIVSHSRTCSSTCKKGRRKNAQRGIYWRQVLAIVSPQINFRTKIGLHFRESRKKLYPSPSSGFCVTRIKQMNFFIRFKFLCVILLVFYFLLFNLTAPPGRQRQRQRPRQRKLFSSTLFFHSISGAINFCMFSLVVSAAFDDLCMFLMLSTAPLSLTEIAQYAVE